MAQTLENKLVVITGGASGIGFAVAQGVLARGGNVVLADIQTTDDADALMAEHGNDRVKMVTMDVTNADGVAATMKEIADGNGGRIDALVNNAGIQIQKPFDEQTPKTFRTLIDINLMGKVHCALAVVPFMKAGGGHIINTSSVHGHVGSDERGPYCAAMHGTLGLTKSMAADLAKYGIQVNSVSFAFVDTPLARKPLQNLIDAGRFNDMDEAVAWRLQYQGNEWVNMDDVVDTYVSIIDGSKKISSGADAHGPELAKGYMDAANRNYGLAIFEDEAQNAVDKINANATEGILKSA